MSELAIQAIGVSKTYEVRNYPSCDTKGKYSALSSVNLEIKKGETVGIIGKNGSGKSTLLSILSNVIKPSSGKVLLYERYSAILEIGSGFHPDLSGYENIFFYGYLLGVKKSEIQLLVDSIIAFSEIENFIYEPVKHYSSGMYLRLALSVALHINTPILFIDEVLATGDDAFKTKVFKKFQETISSEGITVIMVSHNMSDLMQLCNRCIYIKTGEVIFDGKPDIALSKYITEGIYQNSLTTHQVPNYYWHDIQTAPGNDKIRLHSVRIETSNNVEKVIWGIDFSVIIELWPIGNYNSVQPSILFKNLLNQPSFIATSDFSSNKFLTSNVRIDNGALYKFVCKVPGTFLNTGLHTFQVRFGLNEKDEGYVHDGYFTLIVEDTTNITQTIVGPDALRPNFEWDVKKA